MTRFFIDLRSMQYADLAKFPALSGAKVSAFTAVHDASSKTNSLWLTAASTADSFSFIEDASNRIPIPLIRGGPIYVFILTIDHPIPSSRC